MRFFALTLAASALAVVSVTIPAPAQADQLIVPPPYIEPEFPNYLSSPGPARCNWYDRCWYVVVGGPTYVVTPAVPAVSVRPKY